MKVKELIEKLKKINGDLEVWVCDEVEGNDCEMLDVEVISVPYQSIEVIKSKSVAIIRWGGK